jgi:hypothetical protein
MTGVIHKSTAMVMLVISSETTGDESHVADILPRTQGAFRSLRATSGEALGTQPPPTRVHHLSSSK